MRKIIVYEFLTMDGVMQAPGGPEEDTSGGFQYGGWTAPFSDESADEIMQRIMEPADLLLGRHTYDIFASYWPQHADYWPEINEVSKYVLTATLNKIDWENTVLLRDLADIENLRKTDGSDLKIWGSSQLVRLLLIHNLIDEFWLMIHPIILGKGKKLFDEEAMPATYKVSETFVTPSGVIMVNYQRSGPIETGTVGESS